MQTNLLKEGSISGLVVEVKRRNSIILARNSPRSLDRKPSLTITYPKKMKRTREWEAEPTHLRELAESFPVHQMVHSTRMGESMVAVAVGLQVIHV